MNLRLEALSREISKKPFSCGSQELDKYFKSFALGNDSLGVSKAFVGLDEAGEVAGYFTLSAGHVESPHWPEVVRKGKPKYPFPVALIGKLAAREKKKGIGIWLLRQAFEKALMAAEQMGVIAVTVDALDDDARSFYSYNGFHPFPSDPMHLFLTIAEIKDSKEHSEE